LYRSTNNGQNGQKSLMVYREILHLLKHQVVIFLLEHQNYQGISISIDSGRNMGIGILRFPISQLFDPYQFAKSNDC